MKRFKKNDKANLNNYYYLFLQGGVVVTLFIFIILSNVNLRSKPVELGEDKKFDPPSVEEIEITRDIEKPPPPPRPQVPNEVPNEEIIDEPEIEFSSDLDFGERLELPPPPDEEEEEEEIFVVVENMPELIGGIAALQKKVKYPDIAKKNGLEGRVTLQLVVDEKGIPRITEVLQSLPGGLTEAAIEAVEKYARFKPGRQRGKPVKAYFTLPITFKLSY